MRKYILLAVAIIALTAGAAWAGEGHEQTITTLANGETNTNVWDLGKTTGITNVAFKGHSQTWILRGKVSAGSAIKNFTTVTCGAVATHRYTIGTPYRYVWARITSAGTLSKTGHIATFSY